MFVELKVCLSRAAPALGVDCRQRMTSAQVFAPLHLSNPMPPAAPRHPLAAARTQQGRIFVQLSKRAGPEQPVTAGTQHFLSRVSRDQQQSLCRQQLWWQLSPWPRLPPPPPCSACAYTCRSWGRIRLSSSTLNPRGCPRSSSPSSSSASSSPRRSSPPTASGSRSVAGRWAAVQARVLDVE